MSSVNGERYWEDKHKMKKTKKIQRAREEQDEIKNHAMEKRWKQDIECGQITIELRMNL